MYNNTFTATLGGHTLALETGRLAQQAGGAVTLRCGDTMLLATATMSFQEREGIDFFPLTVDFEERLYAAGRIPGSFFRREGRPPEHAVLISRLTDRPLRPLFPKDMRNDVQVIITPLSQDELYQADVLSIIAASAALTISDVPFGGPVGAVRVGYIDGEIVINPTIPEMEHSLLDLRMAGTADAILMVEAGANEVTEEVMLEALRRGHEAMQEVIALQDEMRKAVGKPKRTYTSHAVPEDLVGQVRQRVEDRLVGVLYDVPTKGERNEERRVLLSELVEALGEEHDPALVRRAFDEVERAVVRRRILDEGVRVDGRDPTTIRPLSAEVGLLPRTHGSGLFTRGETQVLSILTLGTPREEQTLDDLSPEESKRYIHHYNFPPFSTGETWPLRGPKRREIGHGALAERALLPVIPPESEFPYTIRVVSEVLSSNGSTSMASVCGSTLSLMDAGVPIKAPVAGIAMGLVVEDDRYRVLTDILGMEDHLGDMDFKVAGTEKGITALQMDIKVKGISDQVMAEALEQARQARLKILEVIRETLPGPRPELSPHAPRMLILHVDPDKLGAVIGTGGKTVRSIQDECGVRVDIEDDGTIYIASTNGPNAQRAREIIERLTEEPEVGKIYTGRVVRITDFGAFVELMPGTDGMVHISQLSDRPVPRVRDVVDINDEIMVMVTNIGPEGKIRLSRRAVLEGWTPEEARAQDRPVRSGRRDRGRRPPRRR
ncbi:MAG TPA: polyribonucleotide nucleotidyltransferase [Anaerolineales bacterium]|nr:polyribonucleotide nucleotidyltransferase [Anaerolineae bacterium]HIQ01150.1 polyribonucleotide nucleotidyltransferase [Anaerolineales bacterium]